MWLGARAPLFLADLRWSPDLGFVLDPRRRIAGASVVSIWVSGVEGIELSRVSMVMSSALFTCLVLVLVIPLNDTSIGWRIGMWRQRLLAFTSSRLWHICRRQRRGCRSRVICAVQCRVIIVENFESPAWMGIRSRGCPLGQFF